MLSGAGGAFNFADTTVARDNPPIEFWLANRFGDAALTNRRLQNLAAYNLSAGLLDALWYVPPDTAETLDLPTEILYENINLAAFHNDWTQTGLFAAVKGADTAASHYHFDGGTFVFDMGGKRFAYELGRDAYAVYTGATKDKLYKVRAEGHNTLVINPDAGPGQKKNAVAEITAYAENADERHAILDLTPLYEDGSEIKRGFKVFRGADALVAQDEVRLTRPSEMYWFMHIHKNTAVALSADKRTATLVLDGVTVTAELQGGADAQFYVTDAWKLHPDAIAVAGEGQNPNYKKLAIHWASVQETAYAVRFTRGSPSQGAVMTPLSDW
jgi:hypothetical protein